MEMLHNPPWINILAGDFDENVVELTLVDFFDSSVNNRHPNFCFCSRESDIVAAALTAQFDIAILVLNNIIFDSVNTMDINIRVERCMKLVDFLSRGVGIPVMVLFGHPRDPMIAVRADDAGAFYTAPIPCKIKDLTEAIASALDICEEV